MTYSSMPLAGNRHTTPLDRLTSDSHLLRWATAFFVGVGILARLRQYLAARSLWLDEAALTLNLLNRSAAELLGPLDSDQGAPILFLLFEDFTVSLGLPLEYALRFLPLVSNTLALLVFAWAVWRVLPPFAATLAVLFLSFSRQAMWYASEAKQYSGDLLASAVGLALFIYMNEKPRPAWQWALSVGLGLLLIFLSHASIIVLGSVALVGFLSALRSDRRGQRVGFLVLGAVWGISFAVNYIVFLDTLVIDGSLRDWWGDGFMPLSGTLDALFWLGESVRRLFFHTLGLGLDALAIFAGLTGLVALARENRSLAAVVALPWLITLLAACLQLYPFDHRLIVFLAPFTALVVGRGVEWLFRLLRPPSAVLAWALVLLLVGQPILAALYNLAVPRTRTEMVPLLAALTAASEPSDDIYLYYLARYAFDIYDARFGLSIDDVLVGAESPDDWGAYYTDLDRLIADHDRVWIVFSDIQPGAYPIEDRVFLEYLEYRGFVPIRQLAEAGTSAYLFDFKP